jgi:hypothetical protein
LSEGFGYVLNVFAIADSYCGDWFKTIGHSVNLSDLFRRESGHLMYEEVERGRFNQHATNGQAHVMEGVTIRFAGFIKVQLCD